MEGKYTFNKFSKQKSCARKGNDYNQSNKANVSIYGRNGI